MAAEDGGDEVPPELPDGLFVEDGANHDGLYPRHDDEDDGLIESKPIDNEECQPQLVLIDHGMPSQKDIDEQEAGGHANYR